MKVIKDIDVKMLKDMLGNMIERCQTSLKPKVELDYNTAIRIYDVLEETQIREERHQTLESACTFMEMEDGTQTNEMEFHNKIDINETMLKNAKAYEKISKMAEHLQKEGGIIPECFGTFRYDGNLDKCFKCEHTKECCMKANSKKKAPDCFRHYNDKDSKCDNCEAKAGCAIATEEREKELEDNKTCFGECVKDNYLCTHCIEYEECSKETIHREELAYKEELDDFI